jgi:hypothetical protein
MDSMKVKAELGAVKESNWREIALRFACGGAITVAASLIAQVWGPTVGGLFLAFPAIFPAGATLIEKHELERKRKKGMHGTRGARGAAAADAAGAALGSLGLLAFAALTWKLLPEHSTAAVIAAATVTWAAITLLAWFVRQHHASGRHGRGSDRPGMKEAI